MRLTTDGHIVIHAIDLDDVEQSAGTVHCQNLSFWRHVLSGILTPSVACRGLGSAAFLVRLKQREQGIDAYSLACAAGSHPEACERAGIDRRIRLGGVSANALRCANAGLRM
jgi:hypothetical protein